MHKKAIMIIVPEISGFVTIFKERTDDIMSKTRKLTMAGMFCTISYLVMVFCRVPVVLFLKYDPKDVIVTMGGFFLGPPAAFFISVAVSFMEMFSVSDTGLIGFIMNVVSTCSFACRAFMRFHLNGYCHAAMELLFGPPLYGHSKGNICRTAGDGIPAF